MKYEIGDVVEFEDQDGLSGVGKIIDLFCPILTVEVKHIYKCHPEDHLGIYAGCTWEVDAHRVVCKRENPSEKAAPDSHQWRKERPLYRGCVAYFPDALMEVAHVSFVSNEQHNPGSPMHWAYGKSMDHADCELRHMVDGSTLDNDRLRHKAKKAWRALADLQTELEKENPELHAKRQAQRDKAAKGE